VAEKPADNSPRGRLRALVDWMTGATPPPEGAAPPDSAPEAALVRIGRYAITHRLGAGGMGVVYAARDEGLQRTVALKIMSSLAHDETARKRFWREARAAASVNHPNVCHIYEVGEDDGELFIAMELLDGEPLERRLQRGPLSVADTVPIGLEMLDALHALHARGVVHRDLKPSNVFVTPHGVKLLDFGLARPSDEQARAMGAVTELTGTGMMVGTPRYMAPEQVTGDVVDARGDLFAAGAILFEMLAGRPAFAGKNAVEILHATLNEQPPALTGSPAVAAVDRVIRRALSKRPEERPASAEAMAEELRSVRGLSGDDTPALARALTRLVVLPFRVLRPDPETDFLAFSLPDAIATSLSGIGSLVVRSSAVAARFAGAVPDLKAVAAEADVDRVVTGTLLRAGEQVRATAQLVEAPGGTLLTSHTVQASLGDLFRLQDDIARRVVEALSLPLGGRDASPTPQAPRNARAYELYLRANELARAYGKLKEARDLYQQCLELDPNFAPAWARLGRCHRVIGKFIEGSPDSDSRAETAFLRAIELDPRLSLAHRFYAQLQGDMGETQSALMRLLAEAKRHGNDPELFAGLVHICRYVGLYDHSIAAHEEARRLDPNVDTSYEQTLLLKGDIETLLTIPETAVGGGGDEGIRIIGLGFTGRRDEARQALGGLGGQHIPAFRPWRQCLEAWLDDRPADMTTAMSTLGTLTIMEDPEAIFQIGWLFCDAGEFERGLADIRRAVAKGYYVAPTLRERPEFDGLRDVPEFQSTLAEAEAGRQRALHAFREAGGERLLGR